MSGDRPDQQPDPDRHDSPFYTRPLEAFVWPDEEEEPEPSHPGHGSQRSLRRRAGRPHRRTGRPVGRPRGSRRRRSRTPEDQRNMVLTMAERDYRNGRSAPEYTGNLTDRQRAYVDMARDTLEDFITAHPPDVRTEEQSRDLWRLVDALTVAQYTTEIEEDERERQAERAIRERADDLNERIAQLEEMRHERLYQQDMREANRLERIEREGRESLGDRRRRLADMENLVIGGIRDLVAEAPQEQLVTLVEEMLEMQRHRAFEDAPPPPRTLWARRSRWARPTGTHRHHPIKISSDDEQECPEEPERH